MTQPLATSAPLIALDHLDHLWFQVAGTLCNLTCDHCFISCSPKNDSFGFLSFDEVRRRLVESVPLGVKEYYFTGGEPFLNPEMTPILIETLKFGPATVLTNGTVLREEWLRELAEAESTSTYCLEFRVSIDGFTPETNDPIRGEGTFDRAMRGICRLLEFDFMPIITATRTWPLDQDLAIVDKFISMLHRAGYERPRLKVLPPLQLGAEENRTGGYHPADRVTLEMMQGFDENNLVCHHSRMVTDRGVAVCPILIDSQDAHLGQTLEDADVPFPLTHGACLTCYQYGAICSNASSAMSSSGSLETSNRKAQRSA